MKKTMVVVAGTIVVVLIGVLVWAFLLAGQAGSGPAEWITIGQPPLEQSLLVYVAEDKGYFEKNGLNVTIREDYPSGAAVMQGLTGGKIDLAVSAEYQVVSAAFKKTNVTILAVINRHETQVLVARKDRGIEAVPDLRGKRIGYPKGNIVDFYLGRFLTLNGIGADGVTLVDVNASHAADAIAGGELDALAYYQPVIGAAKTRLGGNATVFPIQKNQPLYCIVSARSDWVENHSGEVRRFLQALADAEDFSLSHPDEAKAIVQGRLNYTPAYIEEIWPEHQFSLTLDQSLVIAMNDEARWMMANNITNATSVPDFREYVNTGGLKSVKPGSVNIG